MSCAQGSISVGDAEVDFTAAYGSTPNIEYKVQQMGTSWYSVSAMQFRVSRDISNKREPLRL